MGRRFLSVGLSILVIVAFCAVGIYLFLHRFDPPGSWDNPPIYPGAQNVKIEKYEGFGKPTSRIPYRLRMAVEFSTMDGPDKVRNFYVDRLLRDGWWIDDNREIPTPGPQSEALILNWFARSARSPTDYYVDVITTPNDAGGTDVQLQLLSFPGY